MGVYKQEAADALNMTEYANQISLLWQELSQR